MEHTVAVLRAEQYTPALIESRIRELFSLLGGASTLIRPGQRVLVKPNLVSKADPMEAITTHPSVVSAICKIVKECGAQAIIAESPPTAYQPQNLASYYEKGGMVQAAQESGAHLNLDTATEKVNLKGKIVTETLLIRPALDCDLIISAAKLKTHALTIYTGAVKNMFGIVPGFHKAQFHAKYLGDQFMDAILDVCQYHCPEISVIDGIFGMEGDGPSAGRVRRTNLLIASLNPYAADLAAATLVGIDVHSSPLFRAAIARGLCPKTPEALTLIGDLPSTAPVVTYEIPRESEFAMLKLLPSPIRRALSKWVAPYPFFKEDCVGCGRCAEICPPNALTMLKKRPQLDKKKCIKCYCCQETCPFKAISLGRKKA